MRIAQPRRAVSGAPYALARRDAAIALALGLLVFVTHALSPIRSSSDSCWTIPTAASIAHRGDDDLDEYPWRVVELQGYAVEWRHGRAFSRNPIGPSLLAVPCVLLYDAVARVVGAATVEELIARGEVMPAESAVASLVVAIVTVLVFLMARWRGLGAGPPSRSRRAPPRHRTRWHSEPSRSTVGRNSGANESGAAVEGAAAIVSAGPRAGPARRAIAVI